MNRSTFLKAFAALPFAPEALKHLVETKPEVPNFIENGSGETEPNGWKFHPCQVRCLDPEMKPVSDWVATDPSQDPNTLHFKFDKPVTVAFLEVDDVRFGRRLFEILAKHHVTVGSELCFPEFGWTYE